MNSVKNKNSYSRLLSYGGIVTVYTKRKFNRKKRDKKNKEAKIQRKINR